MTEFLIRCACCTKYLIDSFALNAVEVCSIVVSNLREVLFRSGLYFVGASITSIVGIIILLKSLGYEGSLSIFKTSGCCSETSSALSKISSSSPSLSLDNLAVILGNDSLTVVFLNRIFFGRSVELIVVVLIRSRSIDGVSGLFD